MIPTIAKNRENKDDIPHDLGHALPMTKRILILGGGFAGVTAAMHLAKQNLPDTEITLMGNKAWLEYHTIFYRLVAGKRPAEACLPLGIVLNEKVRIVTDKAIGVDPATKTVAGKSGKAYDYDMLVVAFGAQPAYFGIEGMEKHSLTMKSANEALDIRHRVRMHVEAMKEGTEEHRKKMGRFAVVGAGPTGIEIASIVLPYARTLAAKAGIDPNLIQVDLIEAADKLLPALHPKISVAVLEKITSLGVTVLLQKAAASVDDGGLHFKDGSVIDAGTIFWTAGVKPNELLAQIPSMELDKRGRAVVDEQLHAKGLKDVFVVGDCASTQFAGMAQTALLDGKFVAHVMGAQIRNETLPTYKAKAPAYAIPVGIHWAAVQLGNMRFYGFLGFLMRRAADIHAYMDLLPWWRVPSVFFGLTNLDAHGIPNPPKAGHL